MARIGRAITFNSVVLDSQPWAALISAGLHWAAFQSCCFRFTISDLVVPSSLAIESFQFCCFRFLVCKGSSSPAMEKSDIFQFCCFRFSCKGKSRLNNMVHNVFQFCCFRFVNSAIRLAMSAASSAFNSVVLDSKFDARLFCRAILTFQFCCFRF